MKLTILILSIILLSGCAAKGVNTTMFLREDANHFYNLKGEECLESGYQVDKDRSDVNDDHYNLTTYYSNCDLHKIRRLQEFEPKQWGVKPKGSLTLQ